ncbi:glycoside hydrolase family 3 N-terminal domain-containing protein [Bacteroides sp.]|uniref:glycoside hydrolase family 3 N-terminal domain-containing protein n=1 Tax=Bacteroides sp. TaxID=29523 RepID=UPI002611FF25|nr:glycoside hydrolase family 3 N-terminal domain-containing protein [Bacteroides sp.]
MRDYLNMNNYRLLLGLITLLYLVPASAQQKVPQLGSSSIDEVVRAMTLEERITLLIGGEMGGKATTIGATGVTQNLVPGAAGTTHAIPRLGIPSIVLADGPAGLRIQPMRDNDSATYYCTAFPIATLLASTWNTELVEQVGQAIGQEVKEYGIDILLAPALNIQRDPLCGRNFEYYSEDPFLSGKIATSMVRGVQSHGVGTSMKHFAANNQETNRMATNAIISERALREIYLKGFEAVVREAQPWTVMTSYNYINGIYASQSRELLTDILREEWGFKGLVVTDWFGGQDAAAQMHAGNDLLMPGRPNQYDDILAAVKNGRLSEEDINTNVCRMLQLILASPRFKKYPFSNQPDLKAHATITRQSATEGMVLLENKLQTLPLAASVHNIAAFGTTSYDFIAGGSGAGDVHEAYTVSLVEGLSNAGYHLDKAVSSWYKQYMAEESVRMKPQGTNPHLAFFNHPRIGESVPQKELLEKSAKTSDMAIITIGRNAGEYVDRKVENDFQLTAEERALMQNVCLAFHDAGKKVVVILNVCGVVETASWKSLPDAILLAWQAGQEGGNSVADILKGNINPSGKLPMTFPLQYMDVPSSANFPYNYEADPEQIINSIFTNRGLKHELRNVDYTEYAEDIFVGYRYFDTYHKAVSYPFGYGLSYTQFSFGEPVVQQTKEGYTVSVEITNKGQRAGKEVVQLYAKAPKGSLTKPEKELKAFAKTKLLQPGETQTILLILKTVDLASYDEGKHAWVADTGCYQLKIGNSVANITCSSEIVIP